MSQITELNGYIAAESFLSALLLAFSIGFLIFGIFRLYYSIKEYLEFREEHKKNGKN